MSLLRAPAQVTRTFKNIGRIRQICTVFAKHGFQELMGKLGFGRFVPKKYRGENREPKVSAPERLRAALEELGPTFIKLGQVLSSRTDLLPANYANELAKLQDNVSPLPFTVIRHSVERELGASLAEIFASFSEQPLASASIGQAHEAKLKDGTRVVVKVQRPGIDTLIKTDVSVLSALAAALEKYFPETQVLAPQVCVEEFFFAMSLELDFILEANNLLKSRENLKSMPEVYIPEAFLQLSTHKVLVVEHLDGFKLDRLEIFRERGYDPANFAQLIAKAFLKTALEDGFFHADLHMGNLFALPPLKGQTEPRVGMIDFGIMGYLSPRSRESLIRILAALVEEDFETLCMEYSELGTSRGKTDFDSFQRSIQATVAPYLGLPLSGLNIGKLLIDTTGVAARHHIRIPREWMLIFKAIYTLEGTCRKLDANFNAMPLLQDYVKPLLQPKLDWSQITKDFLLGSRDVQTMAQSLPRQLHWFFKRMATNGYALEFRDAFSEERKEADEKNSKRLAAAIFNGCMLLAGAIVLNVGVTHQLTFLQVISSVFFLLALYQSRKYFK